MTLGEQEGVPRITEETDTQRTSCRTTWMCYTRWVTGEVTPQKLSVLLTPKHCLPQMTHPSRAVNWAEHKANILFIWPTEGKTWKKTVVDCVTGSNSSLLVSVPIAMWLEGKL